jgi:RHS repeat-associated protein
LAFLNGSSVQQYFLPLAGGLTAVYNSTGLASYRHADWLGSNRLEATPSGSVVYDGAYAPFGQNYAEMGTTDRSFTGQTQDTIPGIYDFVFRQHSPTQGRWLVPDPSGLAAVDMTNPQTWNRYAYVGNNPLKNVDPLGLDWADCGEDGAGTDWCWGPGDFLIAVPICLPGDCGGGGNHHPPCHDCGVSNPPPNQQPQQPINFPNETYGMPNGFPTNPWGTWGAIIPTAQCGDITCVPIGMGATANVGGSASFTLPFGGSFTIFAGLICDSHWHCGTYWGHGEGAGAGAGVSVGLQGSASNGNTICAFGGPFYNYSGTFGTGASGTADYYQGQGDAPGGTVKGGGISFGPGGGASASAYYTHTYIYPSGGHTCNSQGKLQ